jgi:AcrR family transcriptional regulator
VTGSVEDLREWRLPRGRHGLPREIVARSQRERLLAAAVRVTAAKGYESTTVANLLEDAGVGRESFYELFDDKRECVLAAHTILVDDLEATMRTAYLAPGPWADRVVAALAVALRWFAADPAAARFVLIELTAVGPAAMDRFQSDFSRFIGLFDEGLDEGAPPPDLPRANGLVVSAALARIYEEVVRGRAAELPRLMPELTFELLVPFLGEEAARVEQSRVAASVPPAPRATR